MNANIRENFLKDNKGKVIRLIFANGFQMRGRLVSYDEKDMLIETTAYDSDPVVVPYAAVTTYVPVKH